MLFVYFTFDIPSLAIMALNFHSAQQVSKNSLLHALIKHLKYLQIQNRCFIDWEKFTWESLHCHLFFSKLLMWLNVHMQPVSSTASNIFNSLFKTG